MSRERLLFRKNFQIKKFYTFYTHWKKCYLSKYVAWTCVITFEFTSKLHQVWNVFLVMSFVTPRVQTMVQKSILFPFPPSSSFSVHPHQFFSVFFHLLGKYLSRHWILLFQWSVFHFLSFFLLRFSFLLIFEKWERKCLSFHISFPWILRHIWKKEETVFEFLFPNDEERERVSERWKRGEEERK